MRRILVIIAVFFVLAPGLAHAKALDWFGMGIGTGGGYQQASGIGTDASSGVISELNVRVDLLQVLGVDFAYNMGDLTNPGSHDGLVYDARYRLSALLHVVPTGVGSLYLKAGIGGHQMDEIVQVQSMGNSYHAGGGLELYIAGGVALSFEYLMLLPGAASVERVLYASEQSSNDPFSQTFGALSAAEGLESGLPQLSDFVSASNFQATTSLKYYF
ncbi:MAG: hypothetical protein CMH54_13275 [Myxococcales bacterium]|nr:hypothetical protein [Myxococcales bacterium]